MKSKIIIACIVVVAIVAIVVQGKSDPSIIKVGVILPLSGQYGAVGESMRNSILMNLGDSKNIKVVFEDSKFDAKFGLSAFQKLTNIDKVDMILNGDSPSLEVITPYVRKTNMPVFQMFEARTHENDSIFQLLPFSYGLFSNLGKLAETKYKKIALVYGGSTDVLNVDADYFRKGVSSSTIIDTINLISGSDYKTEITKMLSKNPDAFTLILAKDDGIRFLKQLNALKGSKNPSLICDVNIEFIIDDYIKAVGTSTFEGCLSTNLPDTTTAQFKTEYKNKCGSNPMIGSDWAYDATTIIKGLANIPRNEWIEKIQATNLNGVSGNVAFDETGTRFAVSENRIFKNGKFVKLEE